VIHPDLNPAELPPPAAPVAPAGFLADPSPVPFMLSSPLGPPVGVSQFNTFLLTSRVVTPTPVTTTTLQTTTTRVVVVNGGTTTVTFRTVTVPVTTTNMVNVLSRVTTPQTQVFKYDIPAVAGFRISDNESPIPQTRVFYYINDWQTPFDAINTRLGGSASLPYAMRNTFGFERAVFGGSGSFGLRLPIDSLKVDTGLPGAVAEDSSIGDLFVTSKVLLYRSDTGAISGGLAMTLPTGSRSFAGVSQGDVGLNHHANLQPYVGYLWRPRNGFFVQGFSSFAVPMNSSDVSLWYNDVGVGYLLDRGAGWLTALAPTAELRLTTPLNHEGVIQGTKYGETQILQFLGGLTAEFSRRTTLTFAVAAPLTGPNPYDWGFTFQFNYRF
jgi:hypothetical protein